MDISDLNLSVRTFNAVCRAEIKTVPELYNMYQCESEKLRLLVGNKHFEEIGDALAKHREDVFAENARAREQLPEQEPGEYFIEYDPEVWGDEVTFDMLSRMEGQLVIVNDAWYPGDTPEEDGEGEVMRVLFTDGDTVILDNGEPCREEITRQEMDDSVNCRYCTKVWKVKEANSMNEEKATVIVSEDYTRAVTVTRSIIANAQAAQQSLYEVCKGLKEMRDGKLYKELGYQNFEDYTENEVGIKKVQAYKYVAIATNLTSDFVHSSEQIGTTKLALLAKLDEPTRQEVTETVNVESVTVKELKAQITALTQERDENEHAAELLSNELDSAKETLAAKDKQFQAAMESKKRELDSALEAKERIDKSYRKKHAEWLKSTEEVTHLTERIFSLETELKELESRPVEVAVSEAEAKEIERLTQELEAAKKELALTKKETYAEAQRIADKVRHDMQGVHESEMQALREGYERQLVEESKKPDRSAIDRGKFYTLKTIFEGIVDELESLLDELHDDPRIRYINELDNYWTDNLLYLKREGEGAGK